MLAGLDEGEGGDGVLVAGQDAPPDRQQRRRSEKTAQGGT